MATDQQTLEGCSRRLFTKTRAVRIQTQPGSTKMSTGERKKRHIGGSERWPSSQTGCRRRCCRCCCCCRLSTTEQTRTLGKAWVRRCGHGRRVCGVYHSAVGAASENKRGCGTRVDHITAQHRPRVCAAGFVPQHHSLSRVWRSMSAMFHL